MRPLDGEDDLYDECGLSEEEAVELTDDGASEDECAADSDGSSVSEDMGDSESESPASTNSIPDARLNPMGTDFDLLSFPEFVNTLGKRTSIIAQGGECTLPKETQTKLIETLKQKQDGELHRWAEVLALGEFALKRWPVFPVTLGRRIDPNNATLSFDPLRDHQLSVDLPWVWTLCQSEMS